MRLRSNAHFLAGALVAGIAVLTTTQVAGTDDPGVEAARAEKQLEIALGFQARLENTGVRVWGVEKLVTSYVGAMTKLVEGDAHFRNGDFDSAAATYRHAKALFEQLEASRPERLRRALADGQAALDRLDDVMAVHHYEIALAAEPGNAVAENGMKRARNLPEARKRFDPGSVPYLDSR